MLSDLALLTADLRDAHHDAMLRRIAVVLDDRVLSAAGIVAVERLADGIDARRLIEFGDDGRAAGELDPEFHALGRNHADPGEDHDPGQDDGVPAPPQEVDIGLMEKMHSYLD